LNSLFKSLKTTKNFINYSKYEIYQIGISQYKIVPLIFPKEKFKLQKLKDKLTYPLRVFKDQKTEKEVKKLYKTLTKILIQKYKIGRDTNPYVEKSRISSSYANQD